MHIEISEAQAHLLARVLRDRLGDYSMQIADTDTADFRERLRQERDELQLVLAKLPLP